VTAFAGTRRRIYINRLHGMGISFIIVVGHYGGGNDGSNNSFRLCSE